MLAQQWRYVNLAGNSFCILFPAKGIVSIFVNVAVSWVIFFVVYKE